MVIICLSNYIGGCGFFDNKNSGTGASSPITKEEYRSAFEAGWNAAVGFLGESVAEAEQTETIQSIEEELEKLTGEFAESLSADTVRQEVESITERWNDEKNELLSVIETDSEEESMKYYTASDEVAAEQAMTILDVYVNYENECTESGGVPLTFQKYSNEIGYRSDISELVSLYLGEDRIIDSDQLTNALDYVCGTENGFVLQGESEDWNEAITKLRKRVNGTEIDKTATISNEELRIAMELTSTGKFDPDEYGISFAPVITPKYVIKKALSTEPQANLMDVVLKIGPDLFSIIREMVKSGQISIDELATLGIEGFIQSSGAMIEGATACLLKTACKKGAFGASLKDIAFGEVAAIVKITMQAIKYGYALYNGEISVDEYGNLMAENVIIVACKVAGGKTVKKLFPALPFAYSIGSMVGGLIGEVGVNIIKYEFDRIMMKIDGAGGFEAILPVNKIIDNIKTLPVDEWIDNIHIINRLSSAEDLSVSLWDEGDICIGYDGEYFCPSCGGVFNDQMGFDPNRGYWFCTECGQPTFGDGVYSGEKYEDIMWFCDGCEDFLNMQDGFTDTKGTWKCLKCGYENTISEEDIWE